LVIRQIPQGSTMYADRHAVCRIISNIGVMIMINSIKTAVTGFGFSGKVFQVPFLHASPKFEIMALLRRSADDTKQSYPEIKIARSFAEILNNQDIELVIVNTPNQLHYSMTKEALEAGKHVIVEKPFATTVAETIELIKLAENKNLHLFVFHNRRWDGDFMTVKKVIESGVLGNLVEYEARYDRFKPLLNPKPWKEAPEKGSGILYDLGTHIIDQAVCLFGEPKTITADIRKQRKNSQIDDYYNIMLDYDGLRVTVKSTLLAKEESPRYVVYGQKGSFIKYGVDPQEEDMIAGVQYPSVNWGMESEKNWGILNSSINGVNFRGKIETLAGNYMMFFDNVYEVIREGKPIIISPEQAQITTKIIETAFESFQAKKTQRF
jgi:scyllo-inositol 2-dehydrogenase (NADP+)